MALKDSTPDYWAWEGAGAVERHFLKVERVRSLGENFSTRGR